MKTTGASMHMAAYNNGLMTKKHPLFEQTQEAVFSQDDLDGLLEHEENLYNQCCPETGEYTFNEVEVENLEPLIAEAAERSCEAYNTLVDAINNQ
jgi:hypothetical protein